MLRPIKGTKKRTYRIAPGQKHYMRNSNGRGMTQYMEGQTITLTDEQAKNIKDKLVPVEQTADDLAKEAEEKVLAKFEIINAGSNLFNVVNKTTGKAMNEEPLGEKEALDLHKKLEAGETVEVKAPEPDKDPDEDEDPDKDDDEEDKD